MKVHSFGVQKHITTATINGGVAVVFPYDKELIASLKKTFPHARWDSRYKRWLIPGKTADKGVDRWIETLTPALAEREYSIQNALFELAGIESKRVTRGRDHLILRVPYHPELVALISAFVGATWDSDDKTWSVALYFAPEVLDALPRIETLSDARPARGRTGTATGPRPRGERAGLPGTRKGGSPSFAPPNPPAPSPEWNLGGPGPKPRLTRRPRKARASGRQAATRETEAWARSRTA